MSFSSSPHFWRCWEWRGLRDSAVDTGDLRRCRNAPVGHGAIGAHHRGWRGGGGPFGKVIARDRKGKRPPVAGRRKAAAIMPAPLQGRTRCGNCPGRLWWTKTIFTRYPAASLSQAAARHSGRACARIKRLGQAFVSDVRRLTQPGFQGSPVARPGSDSSPQARGDHSAPPADRPGARKATPPDPKGSHRMGGAGRLQIRCLFRRADASR